jgi:hypothetical protein
MICRAAQAHPGAGDGCRRTVASSLNAERAWSEQRRTPSPTRIPVPCSKADWTDGHVLMESVPGVYEMIPSDPGLPRVVPPNLWLISHRFFYGCKTRSARRDTVAETPGSST